MISWLILFLDPARLSDIRALYPNFESLFQRHVKHACFDYVPRKSEEFSALKLSVISLWYIEEKHSHLPPATRPALVQALLVKQNVQLAWQLVEAEQDELTRTLSYWSSSSRREHFRTQMKTAAGKLPDSQFLQRLENTDDKDLRLHSTVQNAKALAHQQLSRSIDTMVNKMTRAVLEMQLDHLTRTVDAELDNEERKAVRDALVEFIREINYKSAGQRNS